MCSARAENSCGLGKVLGEMRTKLRYIVEVEDVVFCDGFHETEIRKTATKMNPKFLT